MKCLNPTTITCSALLILVSIYSIILSNIVFHRFVLNQGSSRYSLQDAVLSNGNALSSDKPSRKESIADGCYNVFIDVGANIGVHTRFLYEPQKYNNSKAAVSHFAEQFGTERDNRDYCSFAFEPNPVHKNRHLELQAAYKRMGWHYHPIFAGVSDEKGNMTFYHMVSSCR